MSRMNAHRDFRVRASDRGRPGLGAVIAGWIALLLVLGALSFLAVVVFDSIARIATGVL
ncbi:MAG TPA: hypothetical protein VGJ13_05065 [Pseudonocardiaceae bacterium]